LAADIRFSGETGFPKTLTKEFLLVDLVNNLERLAEDPTQVLTRVKEQAASYDTLRLQRAARDFGRCVLESSSTARV